MSHSDTPPLRVLYIAGLGRSGSTVLDRLLARDRRLHSGGELDAIWTQGVLENRLCSCGARFDACPFWHEVAKVDSQLLAPQPAEVMKKCLDGMLPARRLWRMILSRPSGAVGDGIIDDLLERLYRAVLMVSGRDVIVDSSKHPAYLYLLGRGARFDVRVVHLVRDPRAVSYSWGRPAAPDPDGVNTMSHFGDAKASALWLLFNQLTEQVVRDFQLPRLLIRYEDLMSHADKTLDRINAFAWAMDGETPDTKPGVDAHDSVDLVTPHMISGNPMRFKAGPIQLKEDTAWRTEMGRRRKALVTLLTISHIGRYHYPVVPH